MQTTIQENTRIQELERELSEARTANFQQAKLIERLNTRLSNAEAELQHWKDVAHPTVAPTPVQAVNPIIKRAIDEAFPGERLRRLEERIARLEAQTARTGTGAEMPGVFNNTGLR